MGSAREGSNPSGVEVGVYLSVEFWRAAGTSMLGNLPDVWEKIYGELAQMVERSLSMREALGSMPRFSNFNFAVVSCFTSLYEPGAIKLAVALLV